MEYLVHVRRCSGGQDRHGLGSLRIYNLVGAMDIGQIFIVIYGGTHHRTSLGIKSLDGHLTQWVLMTVVWKVVETFGLL